uniref:NAD(P)(+)--arginine ADP-ribosyltransferase n=1 Tax=Amphilophus citrinellus TaxID=61819 RepID=A0A3Q0T1A1_AMPCI
MKPLLHTCSFSITLILFGGSLTQKQGQVFQLQNTKRQIKQELKDQLHTSTFDDCRSEVTVLNDNSMMQKWEFCHKNFSQAWKNAEQHHRKLKHKYLEKDHSSALYMYTKSLLQPVNQNFKSANGTGKLKEMLESHSLFSFLSEAIQILKHSQVTCLSTIFQSESLLHLNISNKQVRFSTFILGSDEWNFTRNISCFEVHSCFGADITYYSALKQNNQVLIPPYEIFKVTDVQTETKECRIIYRLRSNLNCVYNKESNMLHPISSFLTTVLCDCFYWWWSDYL